MAKKKKILWNCGDVFGVPLNNGKYAIGQTLAQRMKNTVGIALFDEVAETIKDVNLTKLCRVENLISLIEVTKEQLDYNVWKILGNKEIIIPEKKFPNEQFRNNKWIGSRIYDAALAEDFLNAFYGLRAWDDWYDPNFLDNFLIDKSKKPKNLILIKSK